MLLHIGSRVRLLHTREEGRVEEILEGDMVMVLLLETNIRIPVSQNDLMLVNYVTSNEKVEKNNTAPVQSFPKADASKKTLCLVFDPQYRGEVVVHYKVYLMNYSPENFSLKLEIVTAQHRVPSWNIQIGAQQTLFIYQMTFDWLSDQPEFMFSIISNKQLGDGSILQKNIRIKPQQFFKKLIFNDLFNRDLYIYEVINLNNEAKRSDVVQNLANYTQQKIAEKNFKNQVEQVYKPFADVQEYAEFSTTIDLHIENLTPLYKSMNNADIIKFQLVHFESFLQKAIRLGVERVFIIHGIGTGKLRSEIHQRLKETAYVKSFKNEYHPKYGTGATEVIFD